MRVRDVMIPSPVSCSPTTSLVQVAKMMADHRCGEIPVCEANRVVGVITDRDITCRAVALGRDPDTTTARDIMTLLVVTVSPDETVNSAITLMRDEQVTRLPVTDREGRLIGMLSHTDIAAISSASQVQKLERDIAQRRRHEEPLQGR